MMRQMRENTKWIMLVTALAFVALMVFEWGMDITGRSAGGVGEIGRVNRTAVMYEDFQNVYRQLYDQAQENQEEPITSQQIRDLENRAFDEVVTRILVQQELQRRGIRVTDEEIRQAAQFNPPPEIRQLFQTEDGFNVQQYQQYISSPQADPQILLYLENYLRDAIPRGKLLRQVSTGVYLTDEELWRRWRDRNETVEVRYIPLDPASIPDDSVSVTEEEIEAYYEDNESEFEVPAEAVVRAIVLQKTPGPADTAAALERARSVTEELRGGADWNEVASLESADAASAESGGELGVFRPGQMIAPFDSAAFQGPVGQVQGPLQTRFGYHVLEVQERWGQDSVRARHVLVPVERNDDSEIALLMRADSLEALSEDLNLDEAASRLGLEVQTTRITTEFPVVPAAGQVGEGSDWAFEEAQVGDVSPLFENSQSFYLLELVESSPAGILSLEEARPAIQDAISRRKKLDLAVQRGERIVERIRAGTPLPAAGAAAGLPVQEAGPFTRVEFVPGLGTRNAAIGTAFGLEPGEVSGVVTTEDNAFILEQVSRTPADSAAWEEQKETQRQQVLSQVHQQRLEAWLESLRNRATVVDRRAEVLQPLDEEPLDQQPRGGFGF